MSYSHSTRSSCIYSVKPKAFFLCQLVEEEVWKQRCQFGLMPTLNLNNGDSYDAIIFGGGGSPHLLL